MAQRGLARRLRWLRASKKSECHWNPIGREITRQLHWVRTSSCESARITDDKDFLNALFLEVNDGVAIKAVPSRDVYRI